jgi:hypothetical protein
VPFAKPYEAAIDATIEQRCIEKEQRDQQHDLEEQSLILQKKIQAQAAYESDMKMLELKLQAEKEALALEQAEKERVCLEMKEEEEERIKGLRRQRKELAAYHLAQMVSGILCFCMKDKVHVES